ncbi:glycoside hydrolase family 16 protein [Amnibacterium kyonggiense]|uniref:Glycosyl hydrolase family 16 n=1 Tax=Amnibacterium kyonggiense TaxID=595671 RepID=A0A4R7FT13_9MICO|nr:glycoside hydrolase family 16 protein [Amnibacterium kyonggiense]TDS80946.1 glycosyl hydrolase family 16 [Amnibacterium kyonggiense]
MFEDRFDGAALDERVWLPAYLPAWSSRSAAAANFALDDRGLRLSIPPGQPLWCPDTHPDPPLNVSAVQSGNWSGPVGGTRGQQPFCEGLRVREAQERFEGFVPHFGRIEVECAADIGPDAMWSAWLIGFEDEPERSGELCLVEVFGDAPAAVGSGVHAFRNPALREEFGVLDLGIDVREQHLYAVDWREDGVEFLVDGEVVRRSAQSPGYPMQLEIAVFEFPGRAPRTRPPELLVRRVSGRPGLA